ncbi:tetratricopeptide repeat protein [Aurantiacibacter rhizosphaerae]|uniref:Tetratricopeptide repeat protein n=1 Tax=Aurantiacibacter rhizosphaerae TaxID=2691582 RepID=A0A844XBR8_9SPHN|nr:hypothetical protein [Aurantiacibacter rhizosphaerae]MWV26955.1 hypothetical protein [Aurantiacibacter rhizosphaerae]
MAQGRFVVFFVVALALAYVSVISAFWNLGRRLPEAIAVEGLAEHPDRIMGRATLSFRESRGKLDSIDFPSLRRALARAPLEEEPFVFTAAQLAASGRIAEAEAMLRESIRRNPRSREGRLIFLTLLAQRGNAHEAVTQIEALYRLMPEQRPVLRDTLVYLASFPGTRQSTLAAVSEDLHKRDILQGLARSGASASMLLETLDAFRDVVPRDARESFVASLSGPLLRAGDPRGALRVWMHFNPEAYADGSVLLDEHLNGSFAPPFGWEVRGGSDGYARIGNNGLEGEHYGRRAALLAQQTAILGPGEYTLSVLAENHGRGLSFDVSCNKEGDIATVDLESRENRTHLNVPNDCPAVTLELRARPSDPPRKSMFRITQVSLERDEK